MGMYILATVSLFSCRQKTGFVEAVPSGIGHLVRQSKRSIFFVPGTHPGGRHNTAADLTTIRYAALFRRQKAFSDSLASIATMYTDSDHDAGDAGLARSHPAALTKQAFSAWPVLRPRPPVIPFLY